MDPVTAALIGMLILVVFAGVSGLVVVASLMKRRLMEADSQLGRELIDGVLHKTD